VAVHDAGPSPPPPELEGPEPSGPGPPEAGEEEHQSVSERLGVLSNWRVLGTLIAGGLMLAIFLTVAVDSRAYFTAASTSPNNAFGADQVDIRVAVPGEIMDGAGLAPFYVTVTWPASQPNPALAGTSISLDFVWSAETVR
jgi:hypothetical protein